MNFKYKAANYKREIFLENQSHINSSGIESSTVTPIIACLCDNISFIINNCKFANSAHRFLKQVINDEATSDDYYEYHLDLKRSNINGVEIAKREYITSYRHKYYMNCEERFDIKFGRKMLEEGYKAIEALLNIRKLFDKNLDSIKFLLKQENAYNDFEPIISSEDKLEIYLSLIKNIVKQHISVILNELSKIAEDPSEMTVSKMMSAPKHKLY